MNSGTEFHTSSQNKMIVKFYSIATLMFRKTETIGRRVGHYRSKMRATKDLFFINAY